METDQVGKLAFRELTRRLDAEVGEEQGLIEKARRGMVGVQARSADGGAGKLDMCVDHLEKLNAVYYDLACDLRAYLERLRGPVPEKTEPSGVPEPAVRSVLSGLASASARLEMRAVDIRQLLEELKGI